MNEGTCKSPHIPPADCEGKELPEQGFFITRGESRNGGFETSVNVRVFYPVCRDEKNP
jgi:hypothetical protein